MGELRTYTFYKDFYKKHHVSIKQYENLRNHFNKLIETVLGQHYYNMGMDVYSCDELACEDLAKELKSRNVLKRFFNKKN